MKKSTIIVIITTILLFSCWNSKQPINEKMTPKNIEDYLENDFKKESFFLDLKNINIENTFNNKYNSLLSQLWNLKIYFRDSYKDKNLISNELDLYNYSSINNLFKVIAWEKWKAEVMFYYREPWYIDFYVDSISKLDFSNYKKNVSFEFDWKKWRCLEYEESCEVDFLTPKCYSTCVEFEMIDKKINWTIAYFPGYYEFYINQVLNNESEIFFTFKNWLKIKKILTPWNKIVIKKPFIEWKDYEIDNIYILQNSNKVLWKISN